MILDTVFFSSWSPHCQQWLCRTFQAPWRKPLYLHSLPQWAKIPDIVSPYEVHFLVLWLFHQVFWSQWHESNQNKEWFKKIEFPFLWPWSWVSNLTHKLNSLPLLSSLCKRKKKKRWQKKKSLFASSLLQHIFFYHLYNNFFFASWFLGDTVCCM